VKRSTLRLLRISLRALRLCGAFLGKEKSQREGGVIPKENGKSCRYIPKRRKSYQIAPRGRSVGTYSHALCRSPPEAGYKLSSPSFAQVAGRFIVTPSWHTICFIPHRSDQSPEQTTLRRAHPRQPQNMEVPLMGHRQLFKRKILKYVKKYVDKLREITYFPCDPDHIGWYASTIGCRCWTVGLEGETVTSL